VKGHRSGKRQKGERSYGASVVRRWLEQPATHHAPHTGDGSMLGMGNKHWRRYWGR